MVASSARDMIFGCVRRHMHVRSCCHSSGQNKRKKIYSPVQSRSSGKPIIAAPGHKWRRIQSLPITMGYVTLDPQGLYPPFTGSTAQDLYSTSWKHLGQLLLLRVLYTHSPLLNGRITGNPRLNIHFYPSGALVPYIKVPQL